MNETSQATGKTTKWRRLTRIGIVVGLGVLMVLCALVLFPVIYFLRDPISSKLRVLENDFRTISTALETYRLKTGDYPTEKQGLAALVKKPETNPIPNGWTQTALRELQDPWGQPYLLRFSERRNGREPQVISLGPDGKEGTYDDLSTLDE